MKINPPANRHLILLQYVFFISAILYFGRTLFVPLSFAVLISCFLYPVCVWLEKHKLKRMGAVLTSIFALTILFSFLVVLMISQLKGFFNEWPELQSKLLNSVEEVSRGDDCGDHSRGLIWGFSGMILFIPFLGILKLVADRTPSLKTLAVILGDEKD